MDYWFIVHDLKAYGQHSDLIGCRIKQPEVHEPRSKLFAQISARAAQDYPFARKLVLLTPDEIEKAKKDYVALKNLRQKIFA